jgi:hypothetical protein
MPSAEYGQASETEAKQCTGDHAHEWPKVQGMPSYNKQPSRQCGYGVQVGPKYSRRFVDKDVANDAAPNAAQHAHNRRHNRVQPDGERLLGPGHGKEGQACSIQEQHGGAMNIDLGIPPERH